MFTPPSVASFPRLAKCYPQFNRLGLRLCITLSLLMPAPWQYTSVVNNHVEKPITLRYSNPQKEECEGTMTTPLSVKNIHSPANGRICHGF